MVYNNISESKVLASCVSANIPCLLMGETGTGKTTIIRHLARENEKTLTRINLNGQTGREELVGKYLLIE
jgi:midasin